MQDFHFSQVIEQFGSRKALVGGRAAERIGGGEGNTESEAHNVLEGSWGHVLREFLRFTCSEVCSGDF